MTFKILLFKTIFREFQLILPNSLVCFLRRDILKFVTGKHTASVSRCQSREVEVVVVGECSGQYILYLPIIMI